MMVIQNFHWLVKRNEPAHTTKAKGAMKAKGKKQPISRTQRISWQRTLLELVFDSLEPPSPEEVFRRQPERKVEELRENLCALHWKDISDDFLKNHWAFYNYLSPKGYQQLVAAMLYKCMTPFGNNNPHIHAALYMVLPKGRDEELHLEMTSAQIDAIRRFLGLCMKTHTHIWLTAVALRRWGEPGHPAFEAGRAFDDANRQHTYPPLSYQNTDLDPNDATDRIEFHKRKAIIEQVAEAFADTPYPSSPLATGYEGMEYDEAFRNTKWAMLHPELLSVHYASLSFFTGEAFRYFVPAFMTADLYGKQGNYDLSFHFSYTFENGDYDDHIKQKFSLFNKPERAAVHAYLHLFHMRREVLQWWED